MHSEALRLPAMVCRLKHYCSSYQMVITGYGVALSTEKSPETFSQHG